MANWVEGKVVENIHWTEGLFTLKVDADIDDFTAGQFASLALDIDGKRIARPYSFLSPPHERPLEFFLYTMPGGVLSNALVKLKPGDTLWVRQKSAGFFVLGEIPPARDLWMIGTGTGVAPFFSILKTGEPWERFEHIVLVQATRFQADLQYQGLIRSLMEQYPGRLSYQPFVSREDIPGTIRGRIPAAVQDGGLEAAVNRRLSVEHSHVMLCGNPDMVKDCTETLKERGFQKNRRRTPGHITTENYW